MEQLLSNKIVYHIIVIILAALAAFIPRYLPVLFFSTRKIPEWFNEWMKYSQLFFVEQGHTDILSHRLWEVSFPRKIYLGSRGAARKRG